MAEDRSKTRLARDRTGLAEDRTLLANERTFSGWARTAFAAIGIGLGFNALFGKLEPDWVPKAIATLFIALGILIIFLAEHRACRVIARLDSHEVSMMGPMRLRLIAILLSIGALALAISIWALV